ncbi:MAG TPA: chemotaxis protein CheX [Acidobacteria bacterium]|nr:chemotaxis protein CheX [Acidobacteriota bacterium]
MNQVATHPKTLIFEACERAFSDSAFMMAAPLDSAPDPEPSWAGMKVHFTGPLVGEMTLRLNRDLIGDLAANFIGADEPPAEDVQNDALGELVNIICGNLLPDLTDEEGVFDITHPEPVETAAELGGGAGQVHDVYMSIDDGFGHLRVVLE